MNQNYTCPCCGKYRYEGREDFKYGICPVCHWENDPVQNSDPDFTGGANKISLNMARQLYSEIKPGN